MASAEDPIAAFHAAMAQRGIALKSMPIGDGNLHRFDVEGDRKGSKNGYYTLHLDGRPAGVFGCWKRGIKETWKANGAPLSDFDLAKLMREVEAERKRRERELAKRQKEVAEAAATLWQGYAEAPPDHPYLVRKGISPNGARVDGQGLLVITMADADGAIWSLQTITADGDKRFMPGGRKRGCMFMIGTVADRIVVAEGFATGCSIHEATGLPVAVAFDAGNLEPAARALREKGRSAAIVIAADDDRGTEGNPGLTKATAAAAAIGAHVAVPVFAEPAGRTDFNDLAVAEGAEAVAAIILAAFPEPECEEDRAEPRPEPQPEPEDNWEDILAAKVAKLNESYFVVAVGGSVRIARTVHDDSLGRDRLVFMRDADMRLRYSHIHLKVGETQRGLDIVKGLGDAWLSHHLRRTYDHLALIPDGPCPADVYNLWKGFGVTPKAGSWATIETHLRVVVCCGNDEHYQWLVGWLAYCVQHPGRQAEVAVVLRGLKGTGKGMVGQMLARIFRDHALHITNSKHLVGNFNAHLVDALFLFLDEAFWAGDKQGEGTLKALITERALMIEPKGVDSFQMPNRLKMLMASNNDWVVPASADERRYFVLDVPDTRKSDKAYFTALASAIEGDELAALLDDLLKLDLAGFDHRNPPHTAGLNKQKLIGAESFVRYWYDCLSSGFLLNTGEDGWPGDVVCQVLHAGYVEHAHQHGDRHPLTINQLGVKLRQLSAADFRISRPHKPWNGVDKPSRYKLQSLDGHRRTFLDAMKIDTSEHEWPEEPDCDEA